MTASLWTRKGALFVFVILVAVVAANLRMLGQSGAAEQAIRDGVRQLVSAYGANDLKTYFSIYTTDMTVMRPQGRWTHHDYYERWSQIVGGGGGNQSADFEDLHVQVLPGGESGVATFKMPVKSRFPNAEAARGRNPEIVYYMTTIWVRRSANWNIVHVHWSVQP